jgi:hypothetical protein
MAGILALEYFRVPPRWLFVKYVLVNYAIRFSGPVTPLTAPPRPAWRRSRPHLPARPFVRYKDALVPRRFSNNTLAPVFPLPSSTSSTTPSCLRLRRAPLTPCRAPWSPQNRYDAASGKNVAARRLALIRSTPRQHCLVDRPTCASTLDNDADEAPGVSAGRRRLSHATTSDVLG